jgi:hypothetical protein
MNKVRKDGSTMTRKQRALRRDISHLVTQKYGDVSYDEMVEVFAHILQRHLKKENEDPLTTWRSPLGLTFFYGERGGELILAVEPQNAEAFETLHRDFRLSGALMVDLPTTLPLNSHINVCVLLSLVDLEIWYRARVVHVSESGVALTLNPMSEEHQVWWAVGKRAFSKVGVAVTVPRTGPRTGPPSHSTKTTVASSTQSLVSGGRAQRKTKRRRSLRTKRASSKSGASGVRRCTESAAEAMAHTGALLQGLVEKRIKLKGADHFEVLGLHWSAYTELVESAYERDMALFRIENFDGVSRAELSPELEAIQTALEAAHAELSCEHTRRIYRVSQINAYQIQSGIDLYLDKGRTALMRNNPKEASECFRRVLELDPSNKKAKSSLTECLYRGG